MAISDLPGQFDLPGTESRSNPKSIPNRFPNRFPIQLACDVGLFSDDAAQLDLLDLARKK
jgi:hypothetical protein